MVSQIIFTSLFQEHKDHWMANIISSLKSVWSRFPQVAALSRPQQIHAVTVKWSLIALYICMFSISALRVDLQVFKDLVAFNAIIKPIILHKQINAPFMVLQYETLVGLFYSEVSVMEKVKMVIIVSYVHKISHCWKTNKQFFKTQLKSYVS